MTPAKLIPKLPSAWEDVVWGYDRELSCSETLTHNLPIWRNVHFVPLQGKLLFLRYLLLTCSTSCQMSSNQRIILAGKCLSKCAHFLVKCAHFFAFKCVHFPIKCMHFPIVAFYCIFLVFLKMHAFLLKCTHFPQNAHIIIKMRAFSKKQVFWHRAISK